MEQSSLYFEDSVLVQQALIALALFVVGAMCLLRLRSGTFAIFGAAGGLLGGVSAGLSTASNLEVRAADTQHLWEFLVEHPTLIDAMGWGTAIGVACVAFAVMADRGSA